MSDEGTEPPSDKGEVNLVRAVVAGRDVPCPACGYNLRDLKDAGCPECGATIVASVEAMPGSAGGGRGMLTFLVLSLVALGISSLTNLWLEGWQVYYAAGGNFIVQGVGGWSLVPHELWLLAIASMASSTLCAVGLTMVVRHRIRPRRRRGWFAGLGATLILLQMIHSVVLLSWLWNW